MAERRRLWQAAISLGNQRECNGWAWLGFACVRQKFAAFLPHGFRATPFAIFAHGHEEQLDSLPPTRRAPDCSPCPIFGARRSPSAARQHGDSVPPLRARRAAPCPGVERRPDRAQGLRALLEAKSVEHEIAGRGREKTIGLNARLLPRS